ncbi:SDR family oxidoreductase [Jiangella anatolica]|uniref:Short-chain dehydrogenase n=1 Tax=Jiangella anatolica TaxID=2670374 RepID=A0A2W2C1E6_9ACTN|nr:SDR family oxidoreductase [Jiangella anatolica]PZF82049.1 short-chain dehydrogenase [Jiangella anatolica]
MSEAGAPIAVVTGGNRGIGLETGRQLAALGHTVVLTARDVAAARSAASGLTGDVVPFRLDVTVPEHADELARFLSEEYGRLDVLVNNAAIHYDTWQRAASADLDVVREAAETNVYGPWRLTMTLLPLLRASAHPRVVNVSSEGGSLASMGGGTPAYSMTKAALNAVTRMLAAELRPDRILVNSICPGWVATDMGGPGGRPVAEGAAGIVWASTLPDDGPTGGFLRDGRPVPW